MSELLSPIQKRDILFGVKKPSQAELTRYGENFEKAGWLSDAADFYIQADNKESLEKLRALACQEGDTFLFNKITRFLLEAQFPSEQLRLCAERAEALGKFRYALKAYEKLENHSKVEELKARLLADGDMQAESTVFIPASEEELVELLEKEE